MQTVYSPDIPKSDNEIKLENIITRLDQRLSEVRAAPLTG